MILDIALLVVLILFAFAGLSKGFLTTFINLVGVLISVVVAVFTCRFVAEFLNNMFKITKTFINMFLPQLKNMGAIMDTTINNAGELDATALEGITAKGKFGGPLTNIIKKIIQGNEAKIIGGTPAEYVAEVLGTFATIVLSAILVFVLVRIILKILSRMFATKGPRTVNGMDKALGLICGIVQGLIFVGIILVVAFVMYNIPTTAQWVTKAFDGSQVTVKVYHMFEKWLEEFMVNEKTLSIINTIISKAK